MRCGSPPMYRYTWPGKDEAFICLAHTMKLLKVAEAMGFHLQLIATTPDEMERETCSQEVPDENSDR